MATIGSLNILLGLGTAGFTSGVKDAGNAVAGLRSQLGGIAGIFGGLVAQLNVGSIVTAAKQLFETGDAAGDMAQQIGVSTEALTRLQYTANQNGSSAQAVATSLGKMNENLADAARRGGPAAQALDRMGLSASDLLQLSPDQAFTKIADGVAGIESPAERAAAAVDLFGKSGQNILNVLTLGSAGIAKFNDESDRLGNTISDAMGMSLGEAKDAMDRMHGSLSGLTRTLAVAAAPLVAQVAESVTGFAVAIRSLSADTLEAAATAAKWAAGLSVAAYVLPRIVSLGKLVVGAYRAMAKAQAVLLAMTGPKGWAVLAGGLAIAAGAVYGLDKAFESVSDSAREAGAAISNAGRAAGGDATEKIITGMMRHQGDLDSMRQDAENGIYDIVAGLQREYNELGKANGELVRHRLFWLGADEGMQRYAATLIRGIEAGQIRQKVDDLTKSLNDQIVTFGMSSRAAEIFRLAQQGAGNAALGLARQLDGQLTAMEKARDLQERGAQVFKQTRTPVEAYLEQMRELRELLAASAIDMDTFARASRQAEEAASRAMAAPQRAEFADMRGGSVAAAAAVEQANLRVAGTAADKQTALLAESRTIQEQMRDSLRVLALNLAVGIN